jgi:hypothetical protein
MMTILIFCAVATVVLAVLVWFGRGQSIAIRSLQDLESHIRPVDILALMNLFDAHGEDFLRSRLTPSQYSQIRRERDRVGAEYVRRIATNSAVLLRANYYARLHSADAAAKAIADHTINLAIRTRAAALKMLLLLYLRILFPSLGDPVRLGQQYQAVLDRTLSSFQNVPALTA